MNYFISDLHFYHENVIKFDKRPFNNVEEMNEILIKNWNEVVGRNDNIYVLGDFCWKTAQSQEYNALLTRLKGHKHLIRGNHDPEHFSFEQQRYWASISDIKEIKYDKHHLILCHYPMPCFKADYNENCWMFYGHVHVTKENNMMYELTKQLVQREHQSGENRGQLMNVGCMMSWMNYRPQSFEVIVEAWRKEFVENWKV